MRCVYTMHLCLSWPVGPAMIYFLLASVLGLRGETDTRHVSVGPSCSELLCPAHGAVYQQFVPVSPIGLGHVG